MLVSVILVIFLASCGAAVEPSNSGGAVGNQATLTSFLVITYTVLVGLVTHWSSTEDSSSDSEEEEEPMLTQQSGTEVKWEFVRTGKSVEGKIIKHSEQLSF